MGLAAAGFASDQPDDVVGARVACRRVSCHAALADDDDAVRHLKGLLHDVGDDDDADALGRDALDEVEAAPRLLHAERREGLVEQHQLAAPMGKAVEFDCLALAA